MDVQQHYNQLQGNDGGYNGAQADLASMSAPRPNAAVEAAFDQQAAASDKKLQELVNKHSLAKVQPWVDNTAESIASARNQVKSAIAHMDADFFGPPGGSLIQQGADGPAPGGSAFIQGGMQAATQRAQALAAEVAKANANFNKDFENGMAQGFRSAQQREQQPQAQQQFRGH